MVLEPQGLDSGPIEGVRENELFRGDLEVVGLVQMLVSSQSLKVFRQRLGKVKRTWDWKKKWSQWLYPSFNLSLLRLSKLVTAKRNGLRTVHLNSFVCTSLMLEIPPS